MMRKLHYIGVSALCGIARPIRKGLGYLRDWCLKKHNKSNKDIYFAVAWRLIKWQIKLDRLVLGNIRNYVHA